MVGRFRADGRTRRRPLIGGPGSFPHTLLIRGPESGAWDIEEARVTYYPNGGPPYTVRLATVTLDDDADLNIWYERPQKAFDV